jgi:RNA polymerase sigma-70 factor (ECF subfamily)
VTPNQDRSAQDAAGTSPAAPVVVATASTSKPLGRDEFESLAVELVAPLTAAARALTRHEHEADDVVQEALYRAWRSIGTFERGTNFRGWLFRILHNVFANRWNRAVRAPAARDPDTIDAPAREEAFPDVREMGSYGAVADRHLDDTVKHAVDGLPQQYRVPFVLFSLGGLSYAEIAETEGIPIGTVMSRLHRARGLLRERLIGYARERGHAIGGDA